MLFNSLNFLFFFIGFYALYLLFSRKQQIVLLVLASYFFYGAWDYRFLALLIGTTLIDYWVGIAISRRPDPGSKLKLLTISLSANLAVLGFFKYFNFFSDQFATLFGSLGFPVSHVVLHIVLPVGVSFYTFQSMAYTIDVYRGKVKPSIDLMEFAAYVSFFPQLAAGPIERAATLLPQFQNDRVITREKVSGGLCLILLGLFKKVVVADNLSPTVDAIFAKQGAFSGEEVLIGIVFFAFQIYGDFSGYTDIARGLARLLGFELMVNFKEPYFARNPSDFWRRWHISLSTWLRDYLYIPLGGNRFGELLTYRNLILTMLLGGLWHGAAWNFVLWGLYHGLLLSVHRLVTNQNGRPNDQVLAAGSGQSFFTLLSIFTMFCFTLYGWLLFRASSLSQVVDMTMALFHFTAVKPILVAVAKLVFYAWPVILLDYIKFRSNSDEPVLLYWPWFLQGTAYAVLMLMFVILGQYEGASFIYFQF